MKKITRAQWGISLVLLWAAVAFWPVREIAQQTGDIEDYSLPAIHLVQGHGLLHFAQGSKLMPEHVYGFHLLLSVVYALLGTDLVHGVYVVWLFSLGTVALTFHIGRRLFGMRVAVLACALLIVAPEFARNAKTILTGNPSAFLLLAVHALLLQLLAQPHSSRWGWFVLGQTLGFSLVIRPDHALFCLPVGIWLVWQGRNQHQFWAKLSLVAVGVLVWGGSVLVANYLYTGDPFRAGQHVYLRKYNSAGGAWSWQYWLQPPHANAGLAAIWRDFRYQWSLHMLDPNRLSRALYVILQGFLVLGLVRTVALARRQTQLRSFLVWLVLVVLPFVLFSGGLYYGTGVVHYLRFVPYLCLLSAIGLVAAWDHLPRIATGLLQPLARTASNREESTTVLITRCLRGLAGGSMIALVAYLGTHLYHWPGDWRPTVDYLQHVRRIIKDDDCVIVANLPVLFVEHFLILDTSRQFYPFHRATRYATLVLQWRPPPHPEWIDEDLAELDFSLWPMEKRRHLNGAVDLYPQTIAENPSLIAAALRAGKKVYLVFEGPYSQLDVAVLQYLGRHYLLQLVERGFPVRRRLPELSQAFVKNYHLVEVLPRTVPPSPVVP